jgi:hypothetical protein
MRVFMSKYFKIFWLGWLVVGVTGFISGWFYPEIVQLSHSKDSMVLRLFPALCLAFVMLRVIWIIGLWSERKSTSKRI